MSTTTNYLDQVAGIAAIDAPASMESPPIRQPVVAPSASPVVDTATITKLIEVSLAQQKAIDSLSTRLEQYETEPPTLHLPRTAEPQQDLSAWIAMGVITITMAGVASFAFSRSPSVTAQQTVTGQQTVIASQAQLLNELAKEAARPRQCKALCF